jgi:hypothetical protein
LGEEIVARLPDRGRRRRVDEPDLLSRWIVHEVAASMRAVRGARSATARNRASAHAVDLILRLWRHRSDWPHGWPPPTAKAMIDQITPRPSWEGRPDPTGSAWIDRFNEAFALWQEEARLWWSLGLLEVGVDPLRAAVDLAGLGDVEEEPDLEMMRRDVQLHDEVKRWLRENGATTTAKARELVKKRLGEIAAARRRLNREVTNKARTAPRRSATTGPGEPETPF